MRRAWAQPPCTNPRQRAVTYVSSARDQGHRLIRTVGSSLVMNWRKKRMAEETHKRAIGRKLTCLFGALLLMVAPLSRSFCVPSDCGLQNSKAAPQCGGMDMASHSAAAHVTASLSCCRMTQIPPATISRNGDATKANATVSTVSVSDSVPGAPVTTVRISSRLVDSSPPHNVQSFLCTLLI